MSAGQSNSDCERPVELHLAFCAAAAPSDLAARLPCCVCSFPAARLTLPTKLGFPSYPYLTSTRAMRGIDSPFNGVHSPSLVRGAARAIRTIRHKQKRESQV